MPKNNNSPIHARTFLSVCMVFALLISLSSSSLFSTKPDDLISLKLRRLQVDPWIVNSTIPNDNCYNPEKMDADYTHQYQIKSIKQCPASQSQVKITSQCIFISTAYQTDFYFDSSKSQPFKMVLDLRTPWTWVKSPQCLQLSRNGQDLARQCHFSSKNALETNVSYNKNYDCTLDNGCKKIDGKCGEIDLTQEGLSVIGQFISTKFVLADKDYRKKAVKGFKVLWAHGLAGQSFLQGDGVLGLGQQHPSAYAAEQKLEENEEENSHDEEEDDDDKKIEIFEQGTDLWSSIERVYKKVNPRVFGLYLAEDDSYEPQLLIGESAVNYTSLMHSPEKMPLRWVDLPTVDYTSEEELQKDYFLWQLPVQMMTIHSGHLKRKVTSDKKGKNDEEEEEIYGYKDRTEILLENETHATLSLQTSAIILPEPMMNRVLLLLQDLYQAKCFLSKLFIRYVQCADLDKKLSVSELAITIRLGHSRDDDVLLNVDPQSLLLGCKKSNGKYNCYLNLQLSVDDHIIFGDAAFRHSYMVFDTEGRRVGFAPAKSKFNENSLWNELKIILEDVEDVIRGDIVFLFRFFLILIFLSAVLFVFVNWKKIFATVKRKFRYSTIVDPAEIANLDLDKSDMVIRHASDDQDVADQIQELEQNERFDAL